MAFVARVAQRREHHESHEQDAHDRAARQDPAQAFDLGLAVAVEEDRDLVVELLDLGVSLAEESRRWKRIVGEKRERGRKMYLALHSPLL